MPLFMVKKEVFEWIVINKQKNIELRKGKVKRGDKAVFQVLEETSELDILSLDVYIRYILTMSMYTF